MRYEIHTLFGTAAAADIETARAIHAAIRGHITENREPKPAAGFIACPACRAEQEQYICFLGKLLNRVHFRCRYCGVTFSKKGFDNE